MPSVYIILLNYNGYKDTIECLQSLRHLEYPNYHVVICDNDSLDDSEKHILDWLKECPNEPFHFIQTGANLGFAGGNNVGIRYSIKKGADYIWLLNNDTVVEPDALTHMVNKMETNKKIGICGSKLCSYYDRSQVVGLGGWCHPLTGSAGHIIKENELGKLAYIIGASMLFRREVFENIGLLQDDYFLYYEELDIAERIREKYIMDVSLDSVVYHKEGASIGNGSAFSSFYLLKNNLKYTWRFHRIYFPVVFMRLTLQMFHPFHKRPYNRLNMFMKVTKFFIKEITSKRFSQNPTLL